MPAIFLLRKETHFSSQLISSNHHIIFSHLRKYPHLLACNWLANSLPTGLDGKGFCSSPALTWTHEKQINPKCFTVGMQRWKGSPILPRLGPCYCQQSHRAIFHTNAKIQTILISCKILPLPQLVDSSRTWQLWGLNHSSYFQSQFIPGWSMPTCSCANIVPRLK